MSFVQLKQLCDPLLGRDPPVELSCFMLMSSGDVSRVSQNEGITPHGRLRLGIFPNIFLPGKRAKPHRSSSPSDACLVPVRFKNTAAHLLVPLIECQPRRMRGDFLDPNFCFHRLSSSGKLPSERISRGPSSKRLDFAEA